MKPKASQQFPSSAPAQIRVLERLTQPAAAWLLSLSPRTLRDHPGIPRDAAGWYNARELVAWNAERAKQRADEEVEASREEESRWEHYRTIPRKHWLAMAGRTQREIAEQAARYPIPLDGATIDLPAVVRALHGVLADGQVRVVKAGETDPLLVGGDSPALERYRLAKAKLAEKDLQVREGTHADLGELEAALRGFAAALSRAGEALKRRFGAEAAELFNAAIDEALQSVEALAA